MRASNVGHMGCERKCPPSLLARPSHLYPASQQAAQHAAPPSELSMVLEIASTSPLIIKVQFPSRS